MHRITFYVTFLLFLVCTWAPGAAVEPPNTLTLSQSVSMALEGNILLQAARHTQNAAESEKKEAFSALWPQLSYSSEVSKLESDRFGESFQQAGFAGVDFDFVIFA